MTKISELHRHSSKDKQGHRMQAAYDALSEEFGSGAAIGSPFTGLPLPVDTVQWARKDAPVDLRFSIEIDREDDGRWIADVADLPGVMTYGRTQQEAVERAAALALRVLADRVEHGELSAPLTPFSLLLSLPHAS